MFFIKKINVNSIGDFDNTRWAIFMEYKNRLYLQFMDLSYPKAKRQLEWLRISDMAEKYHFRRPMHNGTVWIGTDVITLIGGKNG